MKYLIEYEICLDEDFPNEVKFMKIGFVIADENEFYPFLDFARENGAKEYKKRVGRK